jgi:Rhodopirellula transposase DDE domain
MKDLEATVRKKYQTLHDLMDERLRRLWAATEARAIGFGGISLVSRATGLSRPTLRAGLQELKQARPKPLGPDSPGAAHVRRTGAGRKPLSSVDPNLVPDLEKLLGASCRGDPQSPLQWTCKSTRQLASELTRQGHQVSHQKVSELLKEAGYSLQGNRKSLEGASHPDRNAQFEHINQMAQEFQRRGQPVISVDTKKKELIGNFKNSGKEWKPTGQPREVRVHDFQEPELGKAIPYGVYDLCQNSGWVSVGVDHDTPAFAVETIHSWWRHMGKRLYPNATELLITADGGGSNSARARLWKVELQKFAESTGLRIRVCHFPPGTSKWNKIEHRMFSHITQNWRGQPLISREVIVNLISNTKTKQGLRIRAAVDTRKYPTGIKVTKKELAAVNLQPHSFHGDWNYTISPSIPPNQNRRA